MSETIGSIGWPVEVSGLGLESSSALGVSRNQSTGSACLRPVQATRCACVGPKPARQNRRSTIASVSWSGGGVGVAVAVSVGVAVAVWVAVAVAVWVAVA